MKITRKKITSAIGPDINDSDNPYAQNVRYLEEFAEGVVETLIDSYGLRARYEMTSQGVVFKIYNPEEKGQYDTKTYFWEDMDLSPEDMGDDISYAAEDIVMHTVGVYASTSVTDTSDKEAIYGTENYKNSEAYERLIDLGYSLDLLDDGCVIRFPDGDPYATFKFAPPDPEMFADMELTPEEIKRYGWDEWFVRADGDLINERIDFPPTNYDDAVLESIRYFLSHY